MSSWNYVFQNAWYVGNNFNAILYGVEIVLYFRTLQLILGARKPRAFTRSDKTFLSISTFLLCMITIYFITQNFFGEEMWIINEGYPGGTAQYYTDFAAVWYQLLGSASWVTMNFVSDGFLIYRTFIVWADWRFIVLPCILYVGSFGLGISTLYFSSKPNAQGFFSGSVSSHVALSYSSVGLALNVACTTLICVRILLASRDMRRALGQDAASPYTSAAAVIIESMLPYTLFGVAYVVTLGANSPLSILFLSLYAMFNCLSPQMIILRVVMGRAWTTEPGTVTVKFRRSATYRDTRLRFPQAAVTTNDAEPEGPPIDLARVPRAEGEGSRQAEVKIFELSQDGTSKRWTAMEDV